MEKRGARFCEANVRCWPLIPHSASKSQRAGFQTGVGGRGAGAGYVRHAAPWPSRVPVCSFVRIAHAAGACPRLLLRWRAAPGRHSSAFLRASRCEVPWHARGCATFAAHPHTANARAAAVLVPLVDQEEGLEKIIGVVELAVKVVTQNI